MGLSVAAAMIISTIISLVATYGYTITDEVLRNDAQNENSDIYNQVVESANNIARAVNRGQNVQDTINQVVSSVQSIASTLASRGAIHKYVSAAQLKQKAIQELQNDLTTLQLRQQHNEMRASNISTSMYNRQKAAEERLAVKEERDKIQKEAQQIEDKINQTFGGIKK